MADLYIPQRRYCAGATSTKYAPGAARRIAEEYEQYMTGLYIVTPYESSCGVLGFVYALAKCDLVHPRIQTCILDTSRVSTTSSVFPRKQFLHLPKYVHAGAQCWCVVRGSKTRMVMRVAEARGRFVLMCTCACNRQNAFACRHMIAVNMHEGRDAILPEQIHFMFTSAFQGGGIRIPRYVMRPRIP